MIFCAGLFSTTLVLGRPGDYVNTPKNPFLIVNAGDLLPQRNMPHSSGTDF
jgi:hypothetical protein